MTKLQELCNLTNSLEIELFVKYEELMTLSEKVSESKQHQKFYSLLFRKGENLIIIAKSRDPELIKNIILDLREAEEELHGGFVL